MSKKRTPLKRSIFATPRYWYHISSTLSDKKVYLKPWDNSKGFNRACSEPDVPRTCVAPSVEHCLTAVPYCPGDKYVVYRTYRKTKATETHGVFDASVTREGWIQKPCMFVKIGTLTLRHVADGEGVNIKAEAASGDDTRTSGRLLAWWKRRHLRKYIKRS
jgi:hypothetical protein